MSKNRLFLMLFLTLISISAIGQVRKLEDLTVGFACGISAKTTPIVDRSEERRVGKECISRWLSYLV